MFVEFMNNPKLARWHINDKAIHKTINEAKYWSMDWATVWQSVEDMVMRYYKDKEIAIVNTDKINFKNWHQSYHDLTMKVFDTNKDIIYQWAFVYDNLFCMVDFLIKNDEWTYDIVEVKSKNNIRKTTKDEPLLEDLTADVSFQSYVLKNVLWDKFSGKSYLMHLNKEFKKNWEINPQELLKSENISNELFDDEIVWYIKKMKEQLTLSKLEIDKMFPYDWWDHLTYFWTEANKETIRYIPWIGKKKAKLFDKWKFNILDLDEEDIEILHKKDWWETRASEYVHLYQKNNIVINKDAIQEDFKKLKYPLFFYDYETIPTPIPVLDWTSPWQQSTVQYSVHKITEKWEITHKEFLLEANSDNNKALVDQLVIDLEWWNGTYIVWNEWFEKWRNVELAKMYPQYHWILEKINENTEDLMLIFKKFHYFDRKFWWSASIKKVLPVMTEISYDDLEIWNGWVASEKLLKLQQNLIPQEEVEELIKNLLAYCEQDTWAMVRIWEEVKKKL